MNKDIKSLKQVIKELEKVRERLNKKAEKEKIKLTDVYVSVKGEKIHTEEELQELYECDVINSKQFDNYRDKLEIKREKAGNVGNKTVSEVSAKIVSNYIKNLQYEINLEEENQNGK